MSSYHNEKTEIITQILSSFKDKETDLVNYVIYLIKNNLTKFYYGTNAIYNIRSSLNNLQDVKKINTFLEESFQKLDYSELQNIKKLEYYKHDMFINISEIRNLIKDKRLLELLKRDAIYTFNFNFNFIINEIWLNDFLNIHRIMLLNSNKKFILDDINFKYSTLVNNDKNLKKYMNNKDFLIWAYQYLKKKQPIAMLNPATKNDEYKESITLYLDSFFNNNQLYNAEIDKIKKAWQQKQFRDQGKTKKEYHLPLTKQAKNELSYLAKFNNLSENSMLEKLIHQAYLSEMCDEKGNTKFY